MEQVNQISCLINSLTNDEDIRQELWVHYLSGNSIESLYSHLKKLQLEYSDDIELKKTIWSIITHPMSGNVIDLLSHFSDFEKSLMCLLMLGLSIEKISVLKGINEVRIRQSVANIRYNSIWTIRYGGVISHSRKISPKKKDMD